MAEMGAGVPLLNDYKLEFFGKRYPQTVLGGLKLRLGFCGPAYAYINQLLIFLTPWLLGGIFTILVEINLVRYDAATYIVGALIFVFVISVNIAGALLKRRKRSVTPVNDTINVLSDDEEVDFDSCCGIRTASFVIPGKKYIINIIFHAVISGVVCGLAFWYLLPSTLDAVYNSTAATVILYILGWVTLLIAQLPLTLAAPPEPATFRTLDTYEFSSIMRHFYIMICISFHLLTRKYTIFVLTNQVLHVVYVCLPVAWSLGLLPPLDAMFLWIFEQALVVLFGGSPMASDLSLFLMLVTSLAAYLAEFYIPHGVVTVCLMAAFSYFLSINLSALGRQLLKRFSEPLPATFLWKWTYKEALFHTCVLVFTTVIAGVTNNYARKSTSLQNISHYLAYVTMGLLALQVILSQIQSVYVCNGLFRNPVYPHSVQRMAIFQKRKAILKALGYIHRAIVDAVGPAVMLVYLSLAITFPASSSQSTSTAAAVLGASRSFRWVWQSSVECMWDITICRILQLALSGTTWWMQQPVGLQLLLISLFRSRIYQFINKFYTWLTILLMSWVDKKQRRTSTAGQIALNILFLPLVLCIMCIATVLSAPLLPLFTLPVFLFGYPRHTRFWPEAVGASANVCADTIFYKHLVPQLTQVFHQAVANGSLGNIMAGDMLLVRYQDRLVWVQVLERGYLYCSLSIKGLELQETSCHTVEAARIDDMFEMAFESENGFRCCTVNNYLLSALQPKDAAYLKTYSEARTALTGIIESHDALKLVSSGFIQALVWVLLHGAYNLHNSNVRSSSRLSGRHSHQSIHSKKGVIGIENPALDWDSDSISPLESRPASREGRPPTAKSFNSTWSDDNESLILEPLNKTKVNLVAGLHSRQQSSMTPIEGNIASTADAVKVKHVTLTQHSNLDDIFNDMEFGLPALDVHQSKAIQIQTAGVKTDVVKPYSKVAELVSPPESWQDLGVDKHLLDQLGDQFPIAWYQHILDLQPVASEGRDRAEIIKELSQDKGLQKLFNGVVMGCHAVVNILGLGGVDVMSVGPAHVHKVFSGNIPWSPASDRLDDVPQLRDLVLQAYRYSVKLAIDQVLLGEVSSLEELQQYMEEYDRDWYIGNDTDPAWHDAILQGKPRLFSLSHNRVHGTFHSRLLTCQDLLVYMGSLNSELVHSQWANLVLELLYMTNDDEERYSIQAHAAILRNLTVQSADPPLGYPIYSSPPLSVPTA